MINTATAISCVTRAEAKEHLRVDYTDDDRLIDALCLACTQMAEHELQRGLITRDGTDGFGAHPGAVPAGIRQWVLLNVGFFYEHRSAATDTAKSPLPFIASLLDPWRKWQ